MCKTDQFGRSINRRFEKHFIFSNAILEQERLELFNYIKTLKGYSTGGIFYDKDATHCVAPDTGSNCNLAILGCVASNKKLVNPLYIRKSYEAGKFLDETETQYIPTMARMGCDNRTRSGKTNGLFRGIKCVVFLSDNRKADTYRNALEDGGAVVKNWCKSDLNMKNPRRIREEIEYIFTEPDCIDGPGGRELLNFESNQIRTQLSSPVRFLSYFYLFAKVFHPDDTEKWKEQYDIRNVLLMNRLHRKNTIKRQAQPYVSFPSNSAKRFKSEPGKREYWPFRRESDRKPPDLITLDDEDDPVGFKPIIKRELIVATNNSEVIDLGSSDEEAEEANDDCLSVC